ncbi:MAG: hypothetical protein ACM31L_02355 [Actinomycetota bacterium]
MRWFRGKTGMDARGRIAAVALCILALAFNLAGGIAYAEAWRDAAASTAVAADNFVCHSTADNAPADPAKPQLPAKCPLCTVSAAAMSAPPMQPPAVVPPLAQAAPAGSVAATRVVPACPALALPASRAPPSFA